MLFMLKGFFTKSSGITITALQFSGISSANADLVLLTDQPGSSLDPSACHQVGQKTRTAKLGLDATIPWGAEPEAFQRVNY